MRHCCTFLFFYENKQCAITKIQLSFGICAIKNVFTVALYYLKRQLFKRGRWTVQQTYSWTIRQSSELSFSISKQDNNTDLLWAFWALQHYFNYVCLHRPVWVCVYLCVCVRTCACVCTCACGCMGGRLFDRSSEVVLACVTLLHFSSFDLSPPLYLPPFP